MKKRALVLGGAGFIGSHLLESLAASQEYDLLVSGDLQPPRFRVANVKYKEIDVCSPIPRDVCPGCTEVYHLAAVHTTPGHADWEYYWTNVMSTTHVCDYARECQINVILFTSSIAVYGATENPVDEETPCAPTSAYGRSKFAAEQIHQLWQKEQPDKRQLVIVRPGVIYGYQERGNFTRLAKMLSRKAFYFPGRKDTIKSCGYVKDLVRSFRFMRDQGEPTVTYNFCHSERLTSEEICNAFSQVAGYPKATRVIPLPLILCAGWGFELLHRLGVKTSINRARVMKLNQSTNILPKVLENRRFPFQFNLEASLRDWLQSSSSGQFE